MRVEFGSLRARGRKAARQSGATAANTSVAFDQMAAGWPGSGRGGRLKSSGLCTDTSPRWYRRCSVDVRWQHFLKITGFRAAMQHFRLLCVWKTNQFFMLSFNSGASAVAQLRVNQLIIIKLSGGRQRCQKSVRSVIIIVCQVKLVIVSWCTTCFIQVYQVHLGFFWSFVYQEGA